MTWQFIYCDKDVQDASGSDGRRELRVDDDGVWVYDGKGFWLGIEQRLVVIERGMSYEWWWVMMSDDEWWVMMSDEKKWFNQGLNPGPSDGGL